jgi:catechol 2,3-dioxygenase-like lactoylglutathione lyase family enzyme
MPVQLTKDAFDLGIVVADIEASLAFYRDFLGFPFENKMPFSKTTTLHFLKAGGANIKLWEVASPPVATDAGFPLDAHRGYRYITFSVSNLDEVAGAAEGAGVKTLVPATELMPGVKICILSDPDGNAVELVQRG